MDARRIHFPGRFFDKPATRCGMIARKLAGKGSIRGNRIWENADSRRKRNRPVDSCRCGLKIADVQRIDRAAMRCGDEHVLINLEIAYNNVRESGPKLRP